MSRNGSGKRNDANAWKKIAKGKLKGRETVGGICRPHPYPLDLEEEEEEEAVVPRHHGLATMITDEGTAHLLLLALATATWTCAIALRHPAPASALPPDPSPALAPGLQATSPTSAVPQGGLRPHPILPRDALAPAPPSAVTIIGNAATLFPARPPAAGRTRGRLWVHDQIRGRGPAHARGPVRLIMEGGGCPLRRR